VAMMNLKKSDSSTGFCQFDLDLSSDLFSWVTAQLLASGRFLPEN
jgi:hypothetical protein